MRRIVIVFCVLCFVPGAFAAGTCSSGTATPYDWTDPDIVPGRTTIKAVHLIELRSMLNGKRIACGYPASVWSENIIQGVTPVKGVHIEELRTSANDLITLIATSKSTVPILPTYTDSSLDHVVVRKAIHVQQLRAAIDAINCGLIAPKWVSTGTVDHSPDLKDYCDLWDYPNSLEPCNSTNMGVSHICHLGSDGVWNPKITWKCVCP